MPKFNGLHVIRVNDTILIPLPREAWREIEGGCCCIYCSAMHASASPAYWDTLAISAKPPSSGADTAWIVHAPEYHGAKPKKE